MNIIDLTHTVSGGMPVYPGDAQPCLTPLATLERQGFRQLELRMSTHTGTHVDAPAHLLPGGAALDAYPLSAFVGPALVLDGRLGEAPLFAALDSPDARRAQFVFFYTGHSALWGRPEYRTDWPAPSARLLRQLADRGVKGVGVDTLSVDAPDCAALDNHRLLLRAGILIFENLTRLEQLLYRPFTFVGAPLKLPQADGAPVRALAIVGEL